MIREYIPKENQDFCRKFTYQGGSDSITYSLIWSPLADRVLHLFPKWVAPNLITLLAFLLLLVVNILFIFTDWTQNKLPVWKNVFMGVSILIYQTLDNVDGKQARRTKSSSPLGMIFDHGSDSISSFLIAMQILEICYFENYMMRIFYLYLIIMVGYFVAMWTQYSTGVLRLGKINAIDQGLPGYALVSFITIFVDHRLFNSFHWYGTYVQELFWALTILWGLQMGSLSKKLFKQATKSKKQILSILRLPVSVGFALLTLKIFKTQKIFIQIYYPLVYLLCFMWARNMILIQLCFVTKQKFKVFNQGTKVFLFGIIGYLFLSQLFQINSKQYFTLFAFIQGLLLLQFVYSSFKRLAQILKIQVFKIKHQKK